MPRDCRVVHFCHAGPPCVNKALRHRARVIAAVAPATAMRFAATSAPGRDAGVVLPGEMTRSPGRRDECRANRASGASPFVPLPGARGVRWLPHRMSFIGAAASRRSGWAIFRRTMRQRHCIVNRRRSRARWTLRHNRSQTAIGSAIPTTARGGRHVGGELARAAGRRSRWINAHGRLSQQHSAVSSRCGIRSRSCAVACVVRTRRAGRRSEHDDRRRARRGLNERRQGRWTTQRRRCGRAGVRGGAVRTRLHVQPAVAGSCGASR
jgi:hypothetical protein